MTEKGFQVWEQEPADKTTKSEVNGMTENKRYVDIGVEWIDGFIQDHEGDNDLFGINSVINLLNEQDKLIKQLKLEAMSLVKENIIYKNAYLAMKDLEYENEKLKSEIEELENENEILEGKLWNCKNLR